jgi:hypothetical protein
MGRFYLVVLTLSLASCQDVQGTVFEARRAVFVDCTGISARAVRIEVTVENIGDRTGRGHCDTWVGKDLEPVAPGPTLRFPPLDPAQRATAAGPARIPVLPEDAHVIAQCFPGSVD